MLESEEKWLKKIRTNMEELLPENETAEIDIFGVDVGEYIRAKLPDAITRVFITAPVHLLEGKECKDVLFPEKRQDGSGRVVFPEKVLRILSFKMKGWNRPVTRFIDSRHAKSELQYNRYVRGGVNKPVAVLSMSASGRVILDYYSLPAFLRTHEVDSAVYIPVPEIQNGGYDVPIRLADAVGYVCAAMVYEILGQPDMAVQMSGRVVLPEL
ncbi:hypothetical protein [uncultured Coprobacter sp.]|uniref:hypothetical protein n=1 Tax=Coprobacter sp. TaxID=1941478 RepID=UPI002626F46A|nr:hypothetical protein [uncultured Coprobacter sp.]MBS6269831.1 hypothetical protein [Tannerella sp.]